MLSELFTRFGISIHALREEGDKKSQMEGLKHETISIHALREEGDVSQQSGSRKDNNFYPRPPRGGRPALPPGVLAPPFISIHALREEGDTD